MKYEQILPYVEKGLVSEHRHPENKDIAIFNYTQECQFSQAWDEVTRNCRGLIMNVATGEVIARPFPKFFNYGEYTSKGWPIPEEKPFAYFKFDGSLGILYWLNDKPYIATRGSFTSEQAQWANQYIKQPSVQQWLEKMRGDGYTHLFEIIYPANRIVVNYSYSDLVHLASIHTATGKSESPDSDFPLASRVDFEDLRELMATERENEEGYVLHFPKADVRIKVKFAEYVRLHKLITGVSEIAIWEHLRDGKGLSDLIDKVPDEFFIWVKQVSERLLDSYDTVADEAESIYEKVRNLPTRKDQALSIKKMTDNYSGIVFALLDGQGKRASDQIWKMVRPHGARPYKTDLDA